MKGLRDRLIATALDWESAFCNAPLITPNVSELDAALLIGLSTENYAQCVKGTTAVTKGADFVWQGVRYQVKGNRPSGKPGSKVTWVPKARNYDWDELIWILYDPHFVIQEAWMWEMQRYKEAFDNKKRLSPVDLRMGLRLA